MNRFATLLALACGAVSSGASADSADHELARGALLVATEDVVGSDFVETVILLLHYDESGALGLVVNRPLDVAPKEVLPDVEGIGQYEGTLYWGGPVREFTLRALVLANEPPRDAVHIFGGVYGAALDDALPSGATDAAHLRFFLGYAGWSPGQLEREVFYGSWRIVSATEEIVFAADPAGLWHDLQPPRQYRAALDWRDTVRTASPVPWQEQPVNGPSWHELPCALVQVVNDDLRNRLDKADGEGDRKFSGHEEHDQCSRNRSRDPVGHGFQHAADAGLPLTNGS